MQGHFEFNNYEIFKKWMISFIELKSLCSVIYNFEPQGMMTHRYEE